MGFFAEFNAWLNALLNDYIQQYTAQMATLLEPAIVTLGTLYVLIWGYLHIAGRIEEPVLEGLKRIAILALVFSGGTARAFYRRTKFWLDRFMGGALALLGLRLALSAR